MAGGATTYGNNPPPGSAPPGYVWSAVHGGYVPASATGGPQSTGAADTAAAMGASPFALQQLGEQTRATQAGEQFQQEQYAGAAPVGTAPPGTVWSPAYRGYVSVGANGQPRSTEAIDTGMDPLGVRQLAEQTREAQAREQLQRDQFNASQTSRASALAALNQLSTMGGGSAGDITLPPAPDTSAADQAAETATLTASKERRGQQLRSGLRGLASQMRSRGIAGSGTEGAGISNFYAATQADAADTENQLIQAAAARRHGVSDMTYQAGVNAATQNAAMHAQTASQRLSALMQLYGMSY